MTKLRAPVGTAVTNPKFVRWDSLGQVWDTTANAGAGGFVAYNVANVANYGITGAQIGATGIYTADDPAPASAGPYDFVSASGANLSAGDLANLANVFYTDSVMVASASLPPEVQEQLDDIQAKTDLIGTGAGPLVVTPVSADGGTISLFQRDDYHLDDGRAIEWTDTGGLWAGYDMTAGATVALEFPTGEVNDWPMIIVSSTAPKKIRLQLTAAQTDHLDSSLASGNVVLTNPAGRRITLFIVTIAEL